MRTSTRTSARAALAGLCVVALATIAGLGGVRSSASAAEADARNLFKAMSDYMAAQKAISFDYDTNLEIVTKDKQKLGLASSGAITLNRPDKIRATRTGGFADVELLFDGKTLTLLGKTANLYGQLDVPGHDRSSDRRAERQIPETRCRAPTCCCRMSTTRSWPT